MVKNYDRRKWENDPKRDRKIFRRLEDGSKTFGELLEILTWARQTLTNYLKNLREKGCIEKKKRGRNVFYTLIRSHPYVRETLEWTWSPGGADVRIHKRIELGKLDEEQFITSWLNSLKFNFLNVIQAYLLLGKKTKESDQETESIKRIRTFLEESVSDLADTVSFNGEAMVKEIKLGILDPERIWEARNKLLKQIKNEVMNL